MKSQLSNAQVTLPGGNSLDEDIFIEIGHSSDQVLPKGSLAELERRFSRSVLCHRSSTVSQLMAQRKQSCLFPSDV